MSALGRIGAGLAIGVAALAVGRIANYARVIRKVAPLPVEPLDRPAEVAVIIPARDEQHTIGRGVAALRAQHHPDLRIVVVDDASTDRTAAIVAAQAAQDQRVTLVRGEGPPPGWSGKVAAMAAGVRAAGEPEWLLFMDADGVAGPDLLGRLLAAAESSGADLVSSPGGMRRGAGAGLLAPAATVAMFEVIPPNSDTRRVLAIGQCLLLRRTAYDRIGGWSALAGSTADDVDLGTRVRDTGGRVLIVDATAELVAQGHDGFGQLWRSLRKSFVVGSGGSVPVLAAGAVVSLVFGLTPPIAAVTGLLRRDRRIALAGLLGWAAQSYGHLIFARFFGQPVAPAVLAPLSWAALGSTLAAGVGQVLRGTATWRGRSVTG
ncbi:glycosyltransferase [Crossiella cryophila]|uniref:Cellulose synthase/poly-beta-1,6-N-acetylglucosamine synthase-like glycosyltransferase n=1 Tax=Crossiella cryophila TaxID=43355 RepID=A0A7W7CJK4_9PSEU|nr:glycosyltransferase [Crossiella cryophila]MBB4682467.1 cellulose synthase/poly-beta-1,6-N-acetylglucosamine synthase-like glycosyltransferase [Crossiella cryophila]